MAKSNGIKSLKQAARLLNKHSPDGESLAYINKDEAKLLRSHGGSGIQTLAGVPSYISLFDWEVPGTSWLPWETGTDLLTAINPYKAPTGDDDKPIYNPKTGERIKGRSLVQDAMSIWVALRAKKEKEGLNAQEMSEFNRLQAQLTGAKTEFDVGTDFGEQLKPEYETDITKSAAYTPVDFSGQDTPELITTPTAAQGGRIGAFNGGIQGLMPQQGMPQQGMPQQGMPQQGMPQPGLDPRMGFAHGEIPAWKFWGGAEKKIGQRNLKMIKAKQGSGLKLTDEEKEYLKVHGAGEAQGGRIGYNLGGIDMPFQGIGALNRMGYQMGSPHGVDVSTFSEGVNQEFPSNELGAIDTTVQEDISTTGGSLQKLVQEIMGLYEDIDIQDAIGLARQIIETNPELRAHGGRIGAQGGGIMPLLDMGGMEKDYRQDGGFVPIGRREKADDVPARLSKNEFVFTADAVKAAGGGDIDEGAQRMYNVMKNLEAGGEISEQSQGQA